MQKPHRLENADGTTWLLVRRKTIMNRDGEELAAGVYKRPCRVCRFWFDVVQADRTKTRGNLDIVHCVAHRQL